MRRMETPATRAKAVPSSLKPTAALASPAKNQGLSGVRLTEIPVHTKDINSLVESDSVDERQLLCAIHVLDDCAKASTSHDGREFASALAVQRALAFLVELTSSLDNELRSESGRKTDHAPARPNKATVCAARVLGCLKRFVASRKNTRAPFLQSSEGSSDREDRCCVHECHRTLVRLAVLFILFNFSRARPTAAAIVAEGLEEFLLEMAHRGVHAKTTDCTSLADTESIESDAGSCENHEATPESAPYEPFQAHDLLLTIDPFDWCFQSLAADLARTAAEGDDRATTRGIVQSPDAAFLVPLGARTLRYLLDGVTLPSDEIQELVRRLDNIPLRCERCSRTVKHQHKLKLRRLPSIFAFPTVDDDENSVLARVLCFSDRQGTDALTDSSRIVALSSKASVHFALRSLITLAHHLPERSPERRALGSRCMPHLLKIRAKLTMANIALSGRHEQISEPQQLRPHQAIAISASTLAQLSATALVVVCGLGPQAKHSPSHALKQTIQTAASPLQCAKTSELPVVLSARLKAATICAQRELAVWEADMLAFKADRASCERERRHRDIRQAVAKFEQLRQSLAQGLELLRTGRSHPDPAQRFSDWIQSLPTVESVERERQTEQEMRQRLVLEKQYRLEARRRREQDERTLMTTNDCDVTYDAEVSAQAGKHAHFLEMQAKLRSLEDSLENPESGVVAFLSTPSSDIPSPARKSAVDFEKERAKQMAKQQREHEERMRLQQLRCQEHEARERSQMRREDVFFAERALRQQEQARRQSETAAEQLRAARERAMEAQRLKIVEMRQREVETKRTEQEVERMRVEELHSRQLRFFLAEQAKLERQREQTARKRMHAEEQDLRWRWQLVDRAAAQQEQAEQRRRRAEERRARRQKEQRAEVVAGDAAYVAGEWVQCWDDGGNAYYYNSRTGESQWDPPASC